MKHAFSLFAAALFLILSFTPSCTEPDPEPEISTQLDADTKVTMFKNQTGDPGADALQAQFVNTTKKGFTLNLYGSFDSKNEPNKINTLTFRKNNNDTTVYLLLAPTDGKLQTAYIDVKGVKQPWVIKHEYQTGNDNSVKISIYDYDWSADKATLKYEALYISGRQAGAKTEPILNALRKGRPSNNNGILRGTGTDWAQALVVGLAVAEIAFYGSGVGLAAALPAVVVAVGGPVVAIAGTFTVAALLVDLLMSEAGAAELKPGDYPIPKGTPEKNPASGANNPTSKLPQSSLSILGRWSIVAESSRDSDEFNNHGNRGRYFTFGNNGKAVKTEPGDDDDIWTYTFNENSKEIVMSRPSGGGGTETLVFKLSIYTATDITMKATWSTGFHEYVMKKQN